MNKRILFVDHAGVLGGGELSLLTIATAFRNESMVTLFEDGPFRDRLEEADVTVKIIPLSDRVRDVSRDGGLKKDVLAIPGLLRQCFRLARHARKFDVIYANSQKSMVICALAGFLSRRPVVWHLRDLMDESHFSTGHIRIAVGLANRFVRLVIANSIATKDAFVSAGGRTDRVKAIYNGIDPSPFDATDASARQSIRQELGIDDSAFVIGSFSRLADWKGQHVLLEAIRSEPDMHVLLVGDALFAADKSYKTMLKTLTQRHGMNDRVHFMGFRSDVPNVMAACDIVAHSSTAPEPFGRVIIEGMLANRPVVATAAGGAAELIEDGVSGFLVRPNDSMTMRAAFGKLHADPNLRQLMASEGRRSALEKFSAEKMIAEIREVISEL